MNSVKPNRNQCTDWYRKILLGLVGMLLLFSSCVVKVKTIYDDHAPFNTYKTFCWFDNCQFTIDGPAYLKKDSATVEVFKNAIVQELQRKGFTYDQNDPDFLLYMNIIVEEQEGIISTLYETDDWGMVLLEGSVRQTYTYLKGSLIIDIADAKSGKMVWRSDAVEYLDMDTDITNSKLKRGVKLALKKFPP